MVASTTRSNTTCFRGYPGTSCEKRSRLSKTSVAFTPSLTTRRACSSPTGKYCNTCTKSERRSAKQEKRDEILVRFCSLRPGLRVRFEAPQTFHVPLRYTLRYILAVFGRNG